MAYNNDAENFPKKPGTAQADTSPKVGLDHKSSKTTKTSYPSLAEFLLHGLILLIALSFTFHQTAEIDWTASSAQTAMYALLISVMSLSAINLQRALRAFLKGDPYLEKSLLGTFYFLLGVGSYILT